MFFSKTLLGYQDYSGQTKFLSNNTTLGFDWSELIINPYIFTFCISSYS